MGFAESDVRRFWKSVDKNGPVPEHDASLGNCWNWTASTNKRPPCYGRISISGRVWRAHRVSFAIANGPIPAGVMVCHKCDNSRCVNPGHLYAGDARTNANDKVERGRCGVPPHLPPVLTGVDNWNAKLTDEQVAEILIMDEPYVHIAKRYGVSRILVSLIKRGKAWRHIERPGPVALRPLGRPPRAA